MSADQLETPRQSRPAARLLVGVATVVAMAGCLGPWRNVHVVVSGELWRSAQLTADDLESVVHELGIRSVLNLRGPRPGDGWYEAELAVASRARVVHLDFELWADREVSQEDARALVQVMAGAPKPLLIHCWGGADRTGFASALYRYAIAHEEAREASKELSFRYGHLPMFSPRVAAMDRSFDQFVDVESQTPHPVQSKP
jgi:protein tyrosine phosphatase (PTP) superfamily phosphohydrolase (DUF442 family)